MPHERKALVRLKALIHPAIGKAPFLEVVRRAGLRLKDGRAYIAASLSAELQALQLRKLLDGALECAPEIMHPVAVEAFADKEAAHLVDAVKAATPKSEREQVNRPPYRYLPPIDQDFALFRCFRLAIYANDEAEFARLHKLVVAATSGPMGGKTLIQFLAGFPLDQRWLETLHPVIREIFIEHAARMLVEQGQTGETSAIVQRYAGVTATETKSTLNELFLRFDILSANFDSARRRLEALPDKGAPCRSLRSVHRVSDRR